MLRPQNPLAADLDEEYTAHLLESGNLTPKKNNWVDESRWESLGYTAHQHVNTCPSCGAQAALFTGFYHRERTPSGAVRELALSAKAQLPLSTALTVQTLATGNPCPDCRLAAFPNKVYHHD